MRHSALRQCKGECWTSADLTTTGSVTWSRNRIVLKNQSQKRLFALGVIILVTLFFTTMQLWAWTGSLASLTSRLGYAKIDAWPSSGAVAAKARWSPAPIAAIFWRVYLGLPASGHIAVRNVDAVFGDLGGKLRLKFGPIRWGCTNAYGWSRARIARATWSAGHAATTYWKGCYDWCQLGSIAAATANGDSGRDAYGNHQRRSRCYRCYQFGNKMWKQFGSVAW